MFNSDIECAFGSISAERQNSYSLSYPSSPFPHYLKYVVDVCTHITNI